MPSQVPGPQGPAGTAGTNGTNGLNAYTVTTAPFVMPAVNFGSVSVSVTNTGWMVNNTIIQVGAAGYMLVATVINATTALFVNVGYAGNAAPTTNIAMGQRVTPAGPIGPTGPSGISTLNGVSPTTSKGDLIVDNGAGGGSANDVRLAVGGDNNVLHARASQATGLLWQQIDLNGVLTNLGGNLPIALGGTGVGTQQAALDALMPATPATGDLVKHNGTHWVRVPRGTAGQILQVNGGGTDIAWATSGNLVLQRVRATNSAFSTIATTITLNDVIPTNAAGTQILTATITPTTNSSFLMVDAYVIYAMDNADTATLALFHDAVANAIAVSSITTVGGYLMVGRLSHVYFPGSTSATTLNVRIGSNLPSNIYINGQGGARKFGGALISALNIVEYAS